MTYLINKGQLYCQKKSPPGKDGLKCFGETVVVDGAMRFEELFTKSFILESYISIYIHIHT